MEAQLIEEQELLEYDCSDGNQVIVTSTEEVIVTECDIEALDSGVLQILHDGGDKVIVEANFADEDEEPMMNIPQPSPKPAAAADSKSDSASNTCNECGVQFLSKKTLKMHEAVHVDEALYACEFCSATRIHWTEMWVHQCSNTESAPIICPQCFKTVSTKKQLQVHEEVHELQRRFTSKRMDGYFQRKLQEAEDPPIDWGAKPFICGVCGKPFSKMYEVEYHEKLHTGERPSSHKCEKCGMSYINKHDLNKHAAIGCTGEISRKTGASRRKHTEEMQFQII